MKMRPRLAFLTYVVSILTPYAFTMLSPKTTGIILTLMVFLWAFVVLVFSSYVLSRASEERPPKKWYPVYVGFAAVVFFFVSHKYQGMVNNYLFFKWHESDLNQLVAEIEDYDKIREMNDGQRSLKSLNHVLVEPNPKDTVSAVWPGESRFLNTVLKQNGIDKEHYELFKQQLKSLGVISFTRLSDGTLSFTTDGFLDNCYGYAYSETGEKPTYNDCGEIVFWQKLSRHWYAYGTT